ncbi:MAG: Gfo/Idh/MocA family oxidoreductase [Gaiellaceae bacterium MAG52_C11]|nr:Gfo/Idh/MocA family oxidoreductase [Candidatus Gaiellasilicea maunaloa]
MRFGFVGLGRAARLYHLPAVRALEGAEPIGGFDAAEQQRASWREQTGLPIFESVDDLLVRGAPDVVVVATPPASHAEVCVQALEAGAHVICEKPFVTSSAEGDRVLAAAAAAGRRVAVNHQFREKPIFSVVRDAIRAETYGRLAFCQLWQLMNLAPWNEPTEWRAGMSDRTLLEGGVHLVDLMLVLFGEPPVAVHASHSAGFHADPNADAVQLVTLEFPGGRLGQITIDRLCQGGTRYFEVRAECERASLRASLGGRALVQVGMKRAERPGIRLDLGLGGLAWVEHGLRRKVLARSPKEQDVYATGLLFASIVRAFQADAEPPSSGREARDTIAVIEAAYESAERGERVELAGRLASAQTV